MSQAGFFNAFEDVWMHEGVRTPMVDYCGALGHVSPTDMGIKAAREALKRADIPAKDIGSVLTGNMAPGDFDQFFLPRHIGLYAGVPSKCLPSWHNAFAVQVLSCFAKRVSTFNRVLRKPHWWWEQKA